ncbi:MAG: transcriptional regulator [Gammaproteobacteria bacterium]
MALTKDFRETVQTRARESAPYRRALLVESMDCFLSGETDVGKSILRDYINATVGFEPLAKALNKNPKSLHRMLAPAGNPNASNLFEIISFLQDREGVALKVSAKRQAS